MNELEVAQKFIVDRNYHLATTSRETGIPVPTLKIYRANPDKLETAAWINVHRLASLAGKARKHG